MDAQALSTAGTSAATPAITSDERRFLKRWLGVSALLHAVAVVFSTGYYDSDEHFQILEFMGARLGRVPYSSLAWEYSAHIRSWVQPMLYEAPVRALQWLGVQDPFHWALAARALTSLIGWMSIVGLALACREWITDVRWRRRAVLALCLFCFLPYLHARTSSESLAGSFFALAVSIYTLAHGRRRWFAATGALLALSFFCRFQMGIAIAALGPWVLLTTSPGIITRAPGQSIGRAERTTWVALAFIAASAVCLALDAYGYGQWTWTPWNYFDQNLLRGVAAKLGTSPWHDYLGTLATEQFPLGFLLLAGLIAGWVSRPGQVLSLTTLVFFVAHSAISHKEFRFLFPMLAPALVVACFGGAAVDIRWGAAIRQRARWLPYGFKGVLVIVALINGADLLGLCFKPAKAQMTYYRMVYRHEPPVTEIYHAGLDPYAPFSVPLYFYRPVGLVEHEYHSIAELRARILPDRDLWLFHENYELAGDAATLAPFCRLELTAFPAWLGQLPLISGLPGPARFANRWSLFRCREGLTN